MPKPGYTTIIVKEDLRSHLEAIARAEGFRTVSQFLEGLLRVHPTTGGVYPRVNPNTPTNTIQYTETPIETKPNLNPVFEKKGGNLGTVGSGLVGSGRFELPSQAPEAAKPKPKPH